MKLGFIGCGKMGSALLGGVLGGDAFQPEDVLVIDSVESLAEAAAEEHGANRADDCVALVEASDVVLLCVKPADAVNALRSVHDVEKSTLVVSIVAGMTLETLSKAAGRRARVVRVMPNTPALVGKAASAFAIGENVTEKDVRTVEKVLGSVGTAALVEEKLLDAVTGLSGSGPAYVFLMIEALADAGVLMGLPRGLALELAAQTVAGSAEMVLRTGRHPAELKDMVTSPGGTTIAGIEALEAGGLRASLHAAVRAATERSRELGQS